MTTDAPATPRGTLRGLRARRPDHAGAGPGRIRAEGWRRRGPLLPALIFMIVVTQIPFLFTLVLLDAVVEPGAAGFAAIRRPAELRRRRRGQPRSGRSAFNTVVMIVGTVLISVVLGSALALLLDRKFLGRGVVRTLLITPFLVMPVAGALMWKTRCSTRCSAS